MSRNFKNLRLLPTRSEWFYGAKWKTEAYFENNGAGPKAVKDLGFVERIHYGVMDNFNYAVVPDELFLVPLDSNNPITSPRVFSFVADAWSVMKLNFTVACQKNLIQKSGAAFGEMDALQAYENPTVKYRTYMQAVLERFNTNYIPAYVGINNITSYEQYVNAFFDMLSKIYVNRPITRSRWLKSNGSSILDTGLAIKYFEIPNGLDQRKIDTIIDHPSFPYFKNLCLNMGFSILHTNPNILLFDMASPAARPYLIRNGMNNVERIFSSRFTKSYIDDMNLLYNNINLYYNRLVLKYPTAQILSVTCNKIKETWIRRYSVDATLRPSEEKMLWDCIYLRNIEEGNPNTDEKLQDIYKKAIYFHKTVDNRRAMRYISSMFKDEVWNKDYGYHDLTNSIRSELDTIATTGNITSGERRSNSSTSPSTGGSGGGGMGGSSGY